VVPDLVHPFFAEVAKGLSRVLRKRDYSLVIASSEEDPALERSEIDQLLARRVDAVIVASAQRTVESFRRIEEQRTPYILIDRRFAGLDAKFVGVDDEQVGELATAHLIDAGCRAIAHIRGPEVSTALGRLEGYRKVLLRHGLTMPPEYVVSPRSSDDAGDRSGHEAMKRLLALSPLPDAVFATTIRPPWEPLVRFWRAACASPRMSPSSVAATSTTTRCFGCRFSSIDQDSSGIGERAARLALGVVEAKGAPPRPRTVLLTPTLVARESTRRYT
jgi:LacI family transcriptional regulator